MNIDHISVSRKSVWDTCHQQYKYKYHLKTPSPVPEPFYFSYGKIIHKIAEEFVNARGKRKLQSIANDVLTGEILLEGEAAPPLPPEYRNRMPEHLRAIQKLTDQIGMEGETEVEFNLDLDHPRGKMLTGFIDRIIPKKDSIFIIDYKTTQRGNFRKTRSTVTEDLQLRMYARIAQIKYGIQANKIHAALYYLEGANLIGATFTQDSLERAERELLEAYREIEDMPADKAWGNVGMHCRRCDYKSLCPFYKVQG